MLLKGVLVVRMVKNIKVFVLVDLIINPQDEENGIDLKEVSRTTFEGGVGKIVRTLPMLEMVPKTLMVLIVFGIRIESVPCFIGVHDVVHGGLMVTLLILVMVVFVCVVFITQNNSILDPGTCILHPMIVLVIDMGKI